ncbi:MAG TPA: alpha-amylase family glycosyl hydrolase [Terracidiphilus sp.]
MQDLSWWKDAVVYEVYPRSFQDSNGDGIGDLNGIRERLDYLVDLGIDTVWISPIYPSPMADFGYDVADYCGINSIFGTMQDFDRLLEEVHKRGLRMILDFVPNHTSDQHPWFLESRSSRDNPKRDWYLWRDQPNNWLSHFGGSAWEFDQKTQQYYLHEFLKEQPDLNWRNPAVKTAMFDALRFWLRKGVDGFRVDVMWLMIKDDQFRDNPPNPGYHLGQGSKERLLPIYDADRPEIHGLVAEMRGVLEEFGDRVLIGEIYLPVQQLMSYYGKDLTGANLPFNFQLLQCPWNAPDVAQVIADYHDALPDGAWPNWVLGNHDKPRIASRVGAHQARNAAMLLFTLPGTLTMYYGEELGMCDVKIAPEDVQDPAEKNQPGIGMGRDPERTPMPWDGSPLAGFTTGKPWLPLGPEHDQCNVEALRKDATSIYALYRKLLRLRRKHPALANGTLADVKAEGHVLRFLRGSGDKALLIVMNLGHEPVRTDVDAGSIVVSTGMDRDGERVSGSTDLKSGEGLMIESR